LTAHPGIQRTLALMALLYVAVSNAQTAEPLPQSPFNYRQYLAVVAKQHPSIQAGLNQIESARKDVEGAKWQFMPTPSIGAEKSSKTADNLTDRRTTYARLQQPLWTGGRLSSQLDKAQAQETVVSLVLEEQRLSLSTRWLQLWAEVQVSELKEKAFAESEDQHRKYVTQVQRRAKAGHSPRSDVQLSLTRLAAVQAELEQARAQKRQAISRLEQMYGSPMPIPSINWTASLQTPAAPNAQPIRTAKDWLAQVEDKHPSLQKAIAVTRNVQADVALAKSRTSPEVYVRGEIINGDISKTNRQIYIGVTSSFGAGLSTLSGIAAAQAKLDAQEHETETRRREIAEQVLADFESLESQTQRLIFLEQAYTNAEEFLQASERQFAAGRKSWQELMNTAREKSQTLTQLAEAKTLQWLSQQRLHLLSMGVDSYLSSTNP
jgi:outer membrane protein, adhesin transport system